MYRLFAATHALFPALLTPSGVVDPLAATPPLAQKLPVPFAEDVVALPSENIAVLSTDPSRNVYNAFTNEGDEAAAPDGQLVFLDLSRSPEEVDAVSLQIGGWPGGRVFHPLGLGYATHDHNLFAVANMASPPGVEILRLDLGAEPPKMTWVRTLSHPSLTTPNSVVVLSETQVLVTNSFRFSARQHRLLNKAETMLALPLGRVLLLTADGNATTAVSVSEGFALANGLALSDDGRVLAVAGSTGQEVQIYDVSPSARGGAQLDPKAIAYRETIPVKFVVDNLRFVGAAPGNYTFLAAGHPSAFEFLATAENRGEGPLSGSVVVKFTVDASEERDTAKQARSEVNRLFTGRDARVRVVFEDSGAFLGTSTTAVGLGRGKEGKGDEMLVCGLFDRGVMWATDVDLSPVQA